MNSSVSRMTPAQQIAAVDTQIEREFSFAQELIWSQPHRNPFPLCTDRIITGLTKLKNLLQDETADADHSKKIRKRATHLARILEQDSQALIDCRLECVQKMRSPTFLLPTDDFEKTLDDIFVRHLNNAWSDSVSKTPHGGGVDWKQLNLDVGHFFKSLSQGGGSCPTKERVVKERFVTHEEAELPTAEVVIQQESSLSELTLQKHKPDVSGLLIDNLALLAPASAYHGTPPNKNAECPAAHGHGHLEELSFMPKLTNIATESCVSVTPHPNEKLMSRCGQSAAVAMSMKATLCGGQNSDSEPWWHILFGIINKGANDLAVDALSIWSLTEEARASTIKWPKGDVILKGESSFLCYNTKWSCNGSYNSPLVGFSWSYRHMHDRVHLTAPVNTAEYSSNIDLTFPSIYSSITAQATASEAKGVKRAERKAELEDDRSSVRKRLGNMLSWMRPPKKVKS